MSTRARPVRALAAAFVAAALLVAGCATPPAAPTPAPTGRSALSALQLDRALEDRILALDPERISPDDVKILAAGPTPRIILVHGGIYPVHRMMESFGQFLTGMGYPEARIRHPGDQRWSHSPYENAAQIAGFAAWAYERDGMMPMLIGHSQGGIQVVKVLRELAGAYADHVAVWDPLADAALDRTTYEDPLTGAVRPVIGMRLVYASAAAAGGAALILPNQWSMIGNLRTVPDTVENFTGYLIGFDTWAWTAGVTEGSAFQGTGKVRVRNVELPSFYNHVVFPWSDDFPGNPEVRAWIDAYTPAKVKATAPLEVEGRSVLWAADVWYSVRKYWAIEAQQLIRARRAAGPDERVKIALLPPHPPRGVPGPPFQTSIPP